MIFIVVKFPVRPEHADQWPEISKEYTEAVRAEPGNLWFEWSRSIDDPTEYVLVEGFADEDAAVSHVQTDAFKTAIDKFADYVTKRPAIINVTIPDRSEWSEMGEITPR